MNFALAQQGLQHALDFLAPVAQVVNTQVIADERTLSWYGRLTGIQRGIYYPLEYQFLLDRQQYSVLLRDGSFVQFYYQFNQEDRLKSARLAFYPKPIGTNDLADQILDAAEAALERDDEALYDHLYNWAEYMEERRGRPVNTSHVRFDYDDDVEAHEKSHLQFGAIQEFRVPADFYPQPLAFLELCCGIIEGVGISAAPHLAFARNNVLSLVRCTRIISLGSLV